ncbi:MAG: carboxypeptidase regulatory-like domain-containing protein [Gemmatimonadota bacterium]|nr:carboxypeptidase regulatory-like domain-containing protein [Gemmatimonadota bacterium]
MIAILYQSCTIARRARFAICLAAAICAPSVVVAQAAGAPGSARVTGIVFDSLDNRPLGDATVQIIEAPPGRHSYAANSDSLGRFAIESVHAGNYIVGFLHPLLDTLGISAPYDSISVAESSAIRITLAVPGERLLVRAICGDAAKKDGGGMIVGHVSDAVTGAPLSGSAVTLEWPTLVFGSGGPHTETRSLHGSTTREGWFAMCGLSEDEYQLHAEKGARSTGLIDVAVRSHDIARLSLLLGAGPSAPAADSASRGGASLAGIVTAHDGHPLEGVQVVVDGSATSATTDARGAFALAGLPDGTRMAEARALGYEPVRVLVEPSRTERRSVTIAMGKRVNTLDAVTVFGKRSQRLRDLTGFAERKQKGFGRFITRQEIDERNVFSACDLLRRVPGVNVMDDGTTGCTANIRGATTGASPVGTRAAPHLCEPTVYEDNVPFGGTFSQFSRTVLPKDIMGIEVYTSATEPPQFFGACGVIVVWTRTGV